MPELHKGNGGCYEIKGKKGGGYKPGAFLNSISEFGSHTCRTRNKIRVKY